MNKYLDPKKYLQFVNRKFPNFLRLLPFFKNYYRLRSRSDCISAACYLIADFQESTKAHVHSESISRQLSSYKFGIKLGKLPESLKNELYTLFANPTKSQDRYDELKERMIQTPIDLLPCLQWLKLYEMCCFRGQYTLGQIVREKARVQAIRPLETPSISPPISWSNSIAAAIEGHECICPELLNKLLFHAGIKGHTAIKWNLYFSILHGLDIDHEWTNVFDKSDFGEYLEGKDIAIVGPAPTTALDGEIIDSYDLVVRLNHSFDFKGTDPNFKGLRTDITCFNGEQADAFIRERDGILPKELSWCSLKPSTFKSQTRIGMIQANSPGIKIRNDVSFRETQFHGSHNMIPRVSLDFSQFKAKSVRIFHTDLMLTIARQKNYYPDSFGFGDNMKNTYVKSSIKHDPIQQYRTLHQLVKVGKISGDDKFNSVMNMGLHKYLVNLENVYSFSIHRK